MNFKPLEDAINQQAATSPDRPPSPAEVPFPGARAEAFTSASLAAVGPARPPVEKQQDWEFAEQNHIEVQLRESLGEMAAFRAVLDKCCILSMTDVRGVITAANENFCRISEYSLAELIGQNHRLIKSDHHPESFFRQLWQTITRGEVWRGEIQNRAKSGRLYWVDATIGPLLDEHGKPAGYLSVRTDITARKKTEADLAAAIGRMVETSRQAGMAEVATGVLHNVGNVLNSIKVSANLVFDKLRASKVANLGKAAALLREHATDLPVFLSENPQGRQLPGYLGTLAEHLERELAVVVGEMTSLRKDLDHVKDIVAMQQSYARVSGLVETLSLSALVEDALRMNEAALARHEVRLEREYSEVPPIPTDKHKVLQILVNLIRNAKYSLDESGQTDKRMTVCIAASGPGMVAISVRDNGMGISAENLTRIFGHGFTTKRDGHGFGLHSGALAAQELGGCLSAHSDGLGHGATFTLALPLTGPAK